MGKQLVLQIGSVSYCPRITQLNPASGVFDTSLYEEQQPTSSMCKWFGPCQLPPENVAQVMQLMRDLVPLYGELGMPSYDLNILQERNSSRAEKNGLWLV